MPWPTLNDPVHDSQRLFRQLLAAMSEPGTLHTLEAPRPPTGEIGPALWGTLLTLCDLDTNVWLAPVLDTPALRQALTFHTGCRLVDDPAAADFALVSPDVPIEALAFALGSDEYPDRSTTLLVALETLGSRDAASVAWRLSGPGIPGRRDLTMGTGCAALRRRLAANRTHFPRGLDAILTCGVRLAAIPRSTRIEEVA